MVGGFLVTTNSGSDNRIPALDCWDNPHFCCHDLCCEYKLRNVYRSSDVLFRFDEAQIVQTLVSV